MIDPCLKLAAGTLTLLMLGFLPVSAAADAMPECAAGSARVSTSAPVQPDCIDLPGQGAMQIPEPEIIHAWQQALSRLPERDRQLVGDVRMQRAPALDHSEYLPLALRLYYNAALMYYDSSRRLVHVLDPVASGWIRWNGDPPQAEALAAFLSDMSDALGTEPVSAADDPGLLLAWEALVRRVHGWSCGPLTASMPPPGDSYLLEAFLNLGIEVAMDGRFPVEQLLFHELGHAVQFTGDMHEKLCHWASLTPWTDTASHEPSCGFQGGRTVMEHPNVLIRLLLSGHRGSDALYELPADAPMPNPYSRYDLREEHAESFRLMAYEPARLLELSPHKFMYLNALGYSGALDKDQPGPLWYDGRALAELGAAPWITRGAETLLGTMGTPDGPDPFLVSAVLRAHASLLGDISPQHRHPPYPIPQDLPPALAQDYLPGHLSFTLDGQTFGPWPESVHHRLDKDLVRHMELMSLERMIFELSKTDADFLSDQVQDHARIDDAHLRQARYDFLIQALRQYLPEPEFLAFMQAEADFQESAGRPFVALRLNIDARASEVSRHVDHAVAILDDPDAMLGEHERIELLYALGMYWLSRGEADKALAGIRDIPGQTWGAVRRTQLLHASREITGSVPSDAADLMETPFRRLRDHLEEQEPPTH